MVLKEFIEKFISKGEYIIVHKDGFTFAGGMASSFIDGSVFCVGMPLERVLEMMVVTISSGDDELFIEVKEVTNEATDCGV